MGLKDLFSMKSLKASMAEVSEAGTSFRKRTGGLLSMRKKLFKKNVEKEVEEEMKKGEEKEAA